MLGNTGLNRADVALTKTTNLHIFQETLKLLLCCSAVFLYLFLAVNCALLNTQLQNRHSTMFTLIVLLQDLFFIIIKICFKSSAGYREINRLFCLGQYMLCKGQNRMLQKHIENISNNLQQRRWQHQNTLLGESDYQVVT